MESNEDRQLRELTGRIAFLRNITLFVLMIAIIQMIVIVVLPDALDTYIKSWLLVIVGGSAIGLIIATMFARTDPTITIFIISCSTFLSGIILGVSLLMIILKVKNG